MGDRISIQFKNDNEISPVLFSHWGGMKLLNEVDNYLAGLKQEGAEGNISRPLDRLEPSTVMVDFISRCIGRGEKIDSNYYLCISEYEGDNSDNGHFIIDLTKDDPVKSAILGG